MTGQWYLPPDPRRPYDRYVDGIGLIRADTPELLDLAEKAARCYAGKPPSTGDVLCAKCLTPIPEGRNCPACRPDLRQMAANPPATIRTEAGGTVAFHIMKWKPDTPLPPPPPSPATAYVPPAYRDLRPRGSYAHRARVIGQWQAMIVAVIVVITALNPQGNWVHAAESAGFLLFLAQLLHWFAWRYRDDL